MIREIRDSQTGELLGFLDTSTTEKHISIPVMQDKPVSLTAEPSQDTWDVINLDKEQMTFQNGQVEFWACPHEHAQSLKHKLDNHPQRLLDKLKEETELGNRLATQYLELERRFDRYVKDQGSTCYPCPDCGRGMNSQKGCLWCEVKRLKQQLYDALPPLILDPNMPPPMNAK